jgi:hypothetical protein
MQKPGMTPDLGVMPRLPLSLPSLTEILNVILPEEIWVISDSGRRSSKHLTQLGIWSYGDQAVSL